jgi:hypothetical protein
VGFFLFPGRKIMSFKRKRKVYDLDFAETEYDGLRVKVRGLTTGEFLDLMSLSGSEDEGSKETEELLKLFASHLVSWNLEDDDSDELVPTTYEGIRSNDYGMNMAIINAWTSALANIPEKTEKKSDSGEPALVESIPSQAMSSESP